MITFLCGIDDNSILQVQVCPPDSIHQHEWMLTAYFHCVNTQ